MTNRIRNLSPEAAPASGTMAAVPVALQNGNPNSLRQVYELARQQAAVAVENRQWRALLCKLLECDDL